ncbi:hypothetical protein [Salinicola sp. CPA57]|uniref:hypothetical protein n=1 Tax=Salinicola sp. CPA57 TaxID=1949080 RepID=UPI000DA1DDAD|nr:hypothetical protein [Salinicola sp. CPA57]
MVVFLLIAILVILLIATGLWPIALAIAGFMFGAVLLVGVTAIQGWQFWAPVLPIAAIILAIKVIKPMERIKRRQQAAADAQERIDLEQRKQQAAVEKESRKEAAIRAQVEATDRIGG